MKLGRVTGSVVSSQKAGNISGCKILVIKCLDDKLNDTGRVEVCIDTMGAGCGDVVLLVSSSSARLTKITKNVCTDNTIIAIVDSISGEGKILYKQGVQNESTAKC